MSDSQPLGSNDRSQSKPVTNSKRRSSDGLAIFSWALYDWANSAFSTISIVLVAGYFSNGVFPKATYGNWSRVAYPWILGVATLLSAICAPIIGAMADAQAKKHFWLAITALAGACCGFLLGVVPTEYPYVLVVLFGLTVAFFEISYGIYNSFLPELANESTMNRVSAWGFALGYIGGAMALVFALLVFTYRTAWGIEGMMAVRVGIMIMGAWWAIFSLPAIILLRDKSPPQHPGIRTSEAISIAVREVKTTLGDIRQYRLLAMFLIGYLFFNDCVQTVITQASDVARHDHGFDDGSLMRLILMIQFVALPGSLFMAWLSDRWGQRPVLFLCLISWALILISYWLVKTQNQFWILGACVALVMGGIQSVSRAIMGYMTPPKKSAQFFGFFNLSSKATSFLGPFIFGFVYLKTGEYKIAIVSLLGQLLIGFWLVSRVDIEKGRQQALENAT